MSEADRHKIEGYLAHKWGLEANLSAGHPYKTAPPGTGGAAVATLDGTVSGSEGTSTTAWSLVSSDPAGQSASFEDASSVDTNATFTEAGSYVLRLTADDGTVQFFDELTITVDGATEPNSAPVADDQSLSTDENTDLIVTLTATDADGDNMTYSVLTGPSNGILSGTAPDLTYTPDGGFSGSDSFTFVANDGTDDSNTATISITVLTPFEAWAGGSGSSPGDDSNTDGIPDGMAWVLGAADPSSDASTLKPVSDSTSDPDYYIITYRRSDEAHNDARTSIDVVYGNDLTTWNPAVHDGADIIISETDDHYGPGVDRVKVRIDWDLATENRLFVRLLAEIDE